MIKGLVQICSHNELLFAGTMVAMPVQLRGPVVAAPRAARASRSRSTAVVAAASREQNAVPAAVLSLLLATAPLVDVSAAFAAVRIPPDWTHTRSVARRGRRASWEHARVLPHWLAVARASDQHSQPRSRPGDTHAVRAHCLHLATAAVPLSRASPRVCALLCPRPWPNAFLHRRLLPRTRSRLRRRRARRASSPAPPTSAGP